MNRVSAILTCKRRLSRAAITAKAMRTIQDGNLECADSDDFASRIEERPAGVAAIGGLVDPEVLSMADLSLV